MWCDVLVLVLALGLLSLVMHRRRMRRFQKGRVSLRGAVVRMPRPVEYWEKL